MNSPAFRTIVPLTIAIAVGFLTKVSSAQSDARLIDFNEDIAPILAKRCSECHGGERPKGGFNVSKGADLSSYLSAGDLSGSSLWTDYLNADPSEPDSTIMPPVSAGGRLPVGELAIIRTWIEEGAEIPETYQLDSETPSLKSDAPVRLDNTPQRIWAFVGYFHPALVHLPVGLFLAGGFMAVLSFLFGKRLEDFSFLCLLLGTPLAIASAILGWSFATEMGYPGWRMLPTSEEGQVLYNHRWMGTAVAFMSVPLLLVAWHANRRADRRASWLWRLGLLILAAMIGWVGHEGGKMTHQGLYDKAFDRLQGTKAEAAPEIGPPPSNFRMRASF